VSGEIRWKERTAYTSTELRESAKERYIRVAAIDIVIREGIKDICVTGTH
jgi:hypothetical protein